jgi:hypothetical protein
MNLSSRRNSALSGTSQSGKFDPSREEFERYKKVHKKKKASKTENKMSATLYRDPIFGIAHNHDPTIQVLINKRDPIKQMNDSMKQMTLKSQRRLRNAKSSVPRSVHTRFDVNVLATSPLMCFPHFEEMTKFLMQWYKNKEKRKNEVSNRGISQQAVFGATSKFCDSLFLLLQETSRTNLDPAPLTGIYKWYLNRDTMIQQSKQINLQSQDLPYILIELPNGEEVHVMKKNLDFNQVAPKQAFKADNIMRVFDAAKIIQEEEEEVAIDYETPKSRTIILRDVDLKPLPKEEKSDLFIYDKFYYAKFIERMKREREEEKEVDTIASNLRKSYYSNEVV